MTEIGSPCPNLTFATWNIKGGGVDGGGDARLRRQMALLAGLDLSAAAIQECKDWDLGNFRTLHLAEQLLGMRGYVSRRCHLAVFVRESAGLRVLEQRHERGNEWWHSVACVLVETEGFPQPLQLANCHLAPSFPAQRLAEAESFALVAEWGPLIAGGDWNALPASDLEPPGPVTGKHRRKLDCRAAEALEELGLLDAGAHLADMTPTVGHASTLPYSCDRIYNTLPAAAITGHTVITSADDQSDHRPVIAEFDLARAADTVADGNLGRYADGPPTPCRRRARPPERAGETLPQNALLTGHVHDIPPLLEAE